MCGYVHSTVHTRLTFCHTSSLRYIGDGYSKAQECMEDEMREFYGLDKSNPASLSSLCSGQLVAVRAEEEEEILRAQVCEVMADKVKVSASEFDEGHMHFVYLAFYYF